jgi:hypothetical protein
MDPERWAKIDALFHRLRQLPQAERPVFLEQAEVSPDVRREVESLLDQDQFNEESFHRAFAQAAADAVRDDTTSKSKVLVGRKIGSYQVLAFVGGRYGHLSCAVYTIPPNPQACWLWFA